MATVEERVRELLYQVSGRAEQKITDDTRLVAHCQMDSLDLVEFELELEMEFGVNIDGRIFQDDKRRRRPVTDLRFRDVVQIIEAALA